MRSYRVYSSLPLTVDEQCDLDERASHHLARVLRVKTGDRLCVFNGDGNNYRGAIVSATKHQVSVLIDSIEQADNESPLNTCLALGVSKGDRFDWAIKKATELGVTSIVPILSQRVDVRLSPERWLKKQEHWQQIVISACEQSGRAHGINPVRPTAPETPNNHQNWHRKCRYAPDPRRRRQSPSGCHRQYPAA
jgi:16S rRNA (uracil1498-N3)-methyltransferase